MRYEHIKTPQQKHSGKLGIRVNTHRTPYILILMCVALGPVTVLAQVSSNEINYFSRCRGIMDDNARVNCYDELYDRAVGTVSPGNDNTRLLDENRKMREELARIRQQNGETSTSSQSGSYYPKYSYPADNRNREYGRSSSRQESSNRAEEFGLNESTSAGGSEDFGNNEPYVVKNDNGKDELIGRIASLRKGVNGWIITLEHGQVWRQMISKHINLHKGQQVRIHPSIWGKSYRLTAEDSTGFIQVERVQ